MFNSFRTIIHKYFLNRKLKNFECERAFRNYENVTTVGILFDATTVDDHIPIQDYVKHLENQGKKVKLLGFLNSKEEQNSLLNFPVFNKKQLNWYWFPTHFSALDFAEEEFDLLINAYVGVVFPLQYISSLSRAKYRVGLYSDQATQANDFMININEPFAIRDFLKEVDHYLS